MRTKTKTILLLVGLVLLMTACTNDPQPPMTTDSDSEYTLPAGTLPTQEELVLLNEIRQEYTNSLK